VARKPRAHAALTLVAVLLLRWLNPLTSAMMLEARLQAWATQQSGYRTDFQWASLEQISPHAAIAVIASEDQLFPFHAGFDFHSIRVAVRANENGKKPRRQHHLAAGREEPVPVVRPQLRAQGARGLLHGPHRDALAQGADPGDVPEHRAVR
jgi:hypothetical protein